MNPIKTVEEKQSEILNIQEQNTRRLGHKQSDYQKAILKIYEQNEETIMSLVRGSN